MASVKLSVKKEELKEGKPVRVTVNGKNVMLPNNTYPVI